MTEKTITLGGQPFQVRPLPLGKLKKVIPAVSAFSIACAQVASGVPLDESDFDVAAVAIAESLGMSVEEVNQMPAQLHEVIEAITAIAAVCGLAAVGGTKPGESQGTSSVTTDSTPLTDSSATS